MGKQLGRFLQSQTYTSQDLEQPTLGYLPMKSEDVHPHKDLYEKAYSKFIHNL